MANRAKNMFTEMYSVLQKDGRIHMGIFEKVVHYYSEIKFIALKERTTLNKGKTYNISLIVTTLCYITMILVSCPFF